MISSVTAIPQFGALSSAPQLKIHKTSANRPGLITSMFIERLGISWWRCAAWVEHPTRSRSELSSKAASLLGRPEAAAPRQSPRSAHCCGASGSPRRLRPTSPSGWSHWRPTTELGCCRARYLAHRCRRRGSGYPSPGPPRSCRFQSYQGARRRRRPHRERGTHRDVRHRDHLVTVETDDGDRVIEIGGILLKSVCFQLECVCFQWSPPKGCEPRTDESANRGHSEISLCSVRN